MLDSKDLLNIIKKVSSDAEEANKPCTFLFGEVTSVSPIRISVDQKLHLGKKQLVIPEHLTDHTVAVTLNWKTEEEQDHSHRITSPKSLTVMGGLKVGERVILIRQRGGQQYLVVGRTVEE
ncbi:MAG: DUF2577 domain-containing protein [Bacillota bacterium]|nr:DUF2577 domain-containing protein [Bacillota bacterium]